MKSYIPLRFGLIPKTVHAEAEKHSYLDHQASLESVAAASVEVWDEVEQLKKINLNYTE